MEAKEGKERVINTTIKFLEKCESERDFGKFLFLLFGTAEMFTQQELARFVHHIIKCIDKNGWELTEQGRIEGHQIIKDALKL